MSPKFRKLPKYKIINSPTCSIYIESGAYKKIESMEPVHLSNKAFTKAYSQISNTCNRHNDHR